MSSPCKLDANFSITFSATIIDFPPRTLTGAIAVPRFRRTPRACLAPVWLIHRSTLRETQIEMGFGSTIPYYPDGSSPGHGRTNASSPREGPRRHLFQGEGSEGFARMVPSALG